MEQTDNPNRHLDDLQEIRNMMERSSRFISLSGFSGVFVGVFALLGVYIAVAHFDIKFINDEFFQFKSGYGPTLNQLLYFGTDATLVLIASLVAAIFLTYRRANNRGLKVWDAMAKRLLTNLFIPLFAGGIFCLALCYQQLYGLVAPSTLIFYGLALFCASKYTLNDIRYLGIMEIVLGLVSCLVLQYQLIFWALGFGILHIIYGIALYYKYER